MPSKGACLRALRCERSTTRPLHNPGGMKMRSCNTANRRLPVKTINATFFGFFYRCKTYWVTYDAYQQKAEIARKGGLEGAVTGFMQAASWGTLDKILRGLEKRRQVLGNFEMNVAFRFGGTPYGVSERGLKLFAKEVLPVVKSWKSAASARAAE